MYKLGYKPKHHYLLYVILGVLGFGLLVGGYIGVRQLLQPQTVLTQSNPVTKYVPASSAKTQHITKDVFALDLPITWHPVTSPDGTSAPYSWQGTTTEDQARWIDVYVDTIPTTLAVNHLLPVQAENDQMAIIGTTSDNCVNFTDKATESSRTGAAPSKWSGVSFLCDMANYERDVVAIGSAEGINTVTLNGPVHGSHKILLVYTDNSANPDYTLFEEAIKSFRVL